MKAYLLSHTGLGDNLYMIGALRFLSSFYEHIFLLCKDIYIENVKLFFSDTDKISCISFDPKNEFNSCKLLLSDEFNICKGLLSDKYDVNDIFICGCHKSYLKSKITNLKLLNYTLEKQNYTIKYDLIDEESYKFIEEFYTDIKLNLNIFYEYFAVPKTTESINLYNMIKHYKIIFIQSSSSDSKKINIDFLIDKYKNNNDYIIICSDKNIYDDCTSDTQIKIKKKLCDNFVYNKLVYYFDTIINSEQIYIIDSCFTGMILPLKKTNKLKAKIVRIIDRNNILNKPKFISYNHLPSLCDYAIDSNINDYLSIGITPKHSYNFPYKIINKQSIFVKTDFLDYFFDNVYNNIDCNFFLCTGVSDYEINSKYKKYLDDGKIIMWIGHNINYNHKRFFKIPIGFQENERCIGGSASENGKHEGGDQLTINYYYRNRINFENKINKIFVSKLENTHHSRLNLKNILDNNIFYVNKGHLKYYDYLNMLNTYRFVLCPRGNGIDTHRFYETLLVGSIPIVEKNGLENLYNKFPCIIIDKFEDLSQEILDRFKICPNKLKNIDQYLLCENFDYMVKRILK